MTTDEVNWLFTGEVPNFYRETRFSKELSYQLEQSEIKVGVQRPDSELTTRYALQTKHSPDVPIDEWTVIRPDIKAVYHGPDGDSDLGYIECKQGDAHTKGKSNVVTSFKDTGLVDILQHFRQVFHYKYGKELVDFSTENFDYYNNMPEGKQPVTVTCPYMLTDDYHDEQSAVSGEAFNKALNTVGFGVLFRRNGVPVIQHSYHDRYLVMKD